jgi:threonine dehydratase
MRCVPAPPAARRDPPDLESLEGVRHLGSRFPAARVREVSVVRADDLDPCADPAGGTRVWLALEALQVTGSVKVRGALVAVFAHKASGCVVAASTGNHGAAVAYAAAVLGVEALVVLPRAVDPSKVDAITRYGAEVVVGPSDRYDELERVARFIAESRGGAFIPAHDDVHIALGNGASLGFEIVRALGRVPERVLVPSGRSGLATGLAWSFAADDPQPAARVWCTECEPTGPKAVRPVPDCAAGVVMVPAAYISLAMAHAHGQVGILLEEGQAAPLAPVLAGLPPELCGGDLVVVLAGRDRNPRRAGSFSVAPIDDGPI